MVRKKPLVMGLLFLLMTGFIVGAIKNGSAISDELALSSTKKSIEDHPQTAIDVQIPDIDRTAALFKVDGELFPIVETISYSSHVPWLAGRSAWISDYARYYLTTKHFISRSLTGSKNDFHQKIGIGDRFNVFRKDYPFNFYILADLSKMRLFLYYDDLKENKRVLIKTYPISAGRDSHALQGRYQIGAKSCVYVPGQEGFFQHQKIEMITTFGTRWMPLEPREGASSCTGCGIHGLPCVYLSEEEEFVEKEEQIGHYAGEGSLSLKKRDIEELFAIVVSRPTFVEIVPQVDSLEKAVALESEVALWH